MEKEKINIVWFKKDLRLTDHAPLKNAIEGNLPVLLLFIFEPSLQKYPDWDIRHWAFMFESLKELNLELEKYHSKIYICHAEAQAVFDELNEKFAVQTVFSHQETSTKASQQRESKMRIFFEQKNISWHESQNNGVLKELKSRKNWQQLWYEYMQAKLDNPDLKKLKSVEWEQSPQFFISYPLGKKLAIYDKNWQLAGEKNAWKQWKNLVKNRQQDDSKNAKKTIQNNSRLSVYLTYGNVSIRQVFQAYQKLKNPPPSLKTLVYVLQSRCDCIQKFEIEKQIETCPLNKAYQNLEQSANPIFLEAWKNAKTGFPLIDAAMRCVRATGYLDYRFRAIVVSFLTHHLWQNWQTGVYFLAQQFLDYEAGIHFVQFQVQAGVFGTHLRIYNPQKEALKYDSQALFIKKWLPELAHLPVDLAHNPSKITALEQEFYQFEIGKNYPFPIVDLEKTHAHAKEQLLEIRKTELFLAESQRLKQLYSPKKAILIQKK